MKFAILAAAALLASGLSAQAGDAASGEEIFAKRCRSCHSIKTPDGEQLVKGGRTGPNLWGVIGRAAGTEAEFSRYGKSMKAAGEGGLVWDEAQIATFIQDPRAFIREAAGDSKARSNMTYKLSKADQAGDVAAYLATLQ